MQRMMISITNVWRRDNDTLSIHMRDVVGRWHYGVFDFVGDAAMKKPIRVFYSVLSGQFYATEYYKTKIAPDGKSELVTITGRKYNVTQDVARAIVTHDLEFTPIKEENGNDNVKS